MKKLLFLGAAICFVLCIPSLMAQDKAMGKKLQDVDQRMKKIMTDWNVPGCAVGIVKGGKLVYAKGFGYRDVEKGLPVTPDTLFAIGSNTKQFTATAVGMLVDEGKLEWDKPIKSRVPVIQFFNDQLNNSVTLRDMLAHRTGLNSPDAIWFYSNFNRHELFDKLKYCEPIASFRGAYEYNNFMYMAAGEIVYLVSGKTWEDFVRERILRPLGMNSSCFTIEDMEKTPDYAKPYMNNYLDDKIVAIQFNRNLQGIGPAGSINSNVNDMANWVICQMNNGIFKDKQVIPNSIIEETTKPAFISDVYDTKDKEFSCGLYGMGWVMAMYKGHPMREHFGSIDGFRSRVTIFPDDDLGIIILYNTQTQPLRDLAQYEIADRMLGLEKTDWNGRLMDWRKKNIENYKKALAENKPVTIRNAKPSHELSGYTGEYENEIYGNITVSLAGEQLWFQFYNFHFPLNHIHYDQFETPKHEQYGQYRVSFITNDQGRIDEIHMELDKPDVLFKRVETKISGTK
jgi:CubicO group peptidase (beta-lactamase class C family)